MRLTDDQIAALRDRANCVTPPGPWEVERMSKGGIPHVVGHGLYVCGTHQNDRVRADYIAACHPDTVSDLTSEVLESRVEIAAKDARIAELEGDAARLREGVSPLVDACHDEMEHADSPDEECVASTFDDAGKVVDAGRITFGMIRRARAALGRDAT